KNVTLDAVSPTSGATFTYTVGSPTHGTVSGTAPNLTYAPAPDFNGTDSFTFKVNDGTRDSITATVTVTVREVNDAPTGADDPKCAPATVNITVTPVNDAPAVTGVPSTATTPELAAYTFTASATDVDGDSVAFSLVGAPAGAAIDPQSGIFTWTPAEAQ